MKRIFAFFLAAACAFALAACDAPIPSAQPVSTLETTATDDYIDTPVATLTTEPTTGSTDKATAELTVEPRDTTKLQEPSKAILDLMAALEKGDFSELAGRYYSEKYGYATIDADGSITFGTFIDFRGNVIYNMKYMAFDPLDEEGVSDMAWQGSPPYLMWRVRYIEKYTNFIGSKLAFSDEFITLFPKNVEIAWDTWNGDEIVARVLESDTSTIRLLMQGTEYGCNMTIDYTVIGDYFFKEDTVSNNSKKPLLIDFDYLNTCGLTTQQQEKIRAYVKQFFSDNYPDTVTLTLDKKSYSYDEYNYDLVYFDIYSNSGETFKIKMDCEGSMFGATLYIYDTDGNLLN